MYFIFVGGDATVYDAEMSADQRFCYLKSSTTLNWKTTIQFSIAVTAFKSLAN